jgi:predicted phage terminase large subunit-like protein
VKHKPLCWFGEAGPIRRAIEPFMVSRMTQRNAFCRIEWLASVADKATRARSIQGMASMGKVFFPKNSAWKGDVLGQMIRFPAGKHDDSVDVMSLIGRGLEYIRTPSSTKPRPKQNFGGGAWMG